ncbi:hypothetical protein FKP32DRAFT_649781 [Trametes sanguinea]|nr:hypothetical protein FKP32DRAFT_649781 [Trametes sanguinea]
MRWDIAGPRARHTGCGNAGGVVQRLCGHRENAKVGTRYIQNRRRLGLGFPMSCAFSTSSTTEGAVPGTETWKSEERGYPTQGRENRDVTMQVNTESGQGKFFDIAEMLGKGQKARKVHRAVRYWRTIDPGRLVSYSSRSRGSRDSSGWHTYS